VCINDAYALNKNMQKAPFFGADFTVAAPQFYDMKRNVSKKVQHTPIAGARVRRPLSSLFSTHKYINIINI
jgi:hypothetical protein